MKPATIKTAGYLISSVSVLLLGAVSWRSARGDPLVIAAVILGMATSVIGMALRWQSYRMEEK